MMAKQRTGPRLRDHLRPDLHVIFVGINPGLRSAAVGHHFAGHSNRFWKLLLDSGVWASLTSSIDQVPESMTWTRASIGQGPPPSNEKFGDTSLERSRCWASPYFASYSRTSRVRAVWRWVPLRRDLPGFRCFSCPIRADVMPITPTM